MELSIWLQAIWVGIGATVIMDIWALIQKRVLGIAPLDYALVARWVCLIPNGQWVHRPIMATPPVKGERLLGWALHYLTGIVFALVHTLILGETWLMNPSIVPALMTGIVTLAFPFLIIQPCLGFGIAATKTPSPWKARGLSLLAHSFYGFGLYLTALVTL
ncbi:DUF2938 domain-containing protein [Vibrio europaeus]|uniref:DUF2938 domain-containing protein n=1 Tax=Vibrio europaeus TaxID=300876 RepID=UPI00233EA4AD|nr:DUF2938 domain-containing protein [Vibrio europaeus]MDC5819148.1 DUF2938 domain-containing protein [Vibrio europaeus]MDC5870829.1 DUF2938 domain-containing protein [Vibrio europaeus]